MSTCAQPGINIWLLWLEHLPASGPWTPSEVNTDCAGRSVWCNKDTHIQTLPHSWSWYMKWNKELGSCLTVTWTTTGGWCVWLRGKLCFRLRQIMAQRCPARSLVSELKRRHNSGIQCTSDTFEQANDCIEYDWAQTWTLFCGLTDPCHAVSQPQGSCGVLLINKQKLCLHSPKHTYRTQYECIHEVYCVEHTDMCILVMMQLSVNELHRFEL